MSREIPRERGLRMGELSLRLLLLGPYQTDDHGNRFENHANTCKDRYVSNVEIVRTFVVITLNVLIMINYFS